MLVTRVIGACPQCTTPDAFGNVMVAADHVLRGCKACRYTQRVPLPALSKKIIYLDQFFFSAAFREKDQRFVQAAALIKEASSRQLLVAPYSSVHEDETFQWRGFNGLTKEELMEFIKSASRGHEFEPSYNVEHDQVLDAFEGFIGDHPDGFNVNRRTALRPDINQWEDYFRIDVGSYRDDVELKRQLKSQCVEDLVRDVFPAWRRSAGSFKDQVNLELQDAGRLYVKFYLDYVRRIASGDYDAIFDSPIVSKIVQDMLQMLPKDQGIEDKLSVLHSFFSSDHFANVPYHWISSRMFAVLRDQVRNGAYAKADEALRRLSGVFQDISHISLYAPYVDAIVVDQPMFSIVNDGRIALSDRFDVKVFSLNNWGELTRWLQSLLENISVEHRAGLALAYP